MRSHTIRRFFIIYLSFVVIMTSTLAPLYWITLDELKRDAMRTYRQVLAGGLSELESELDDVVMAGVGLFEDPSVRALSYLKTPHDNRQAYGIWLSLRAASLAQAGMSIARESGILFPGGAVLTQNRFFSSLSEYYGAFLAREGTENAEEWLDAMRGNGGAFSMSAMTFAENEKRWDAIVFSMPLPLFAPGGSLFFCAIPVESVTDLLTLPEMLENGGIHIQGPTGTLYKRNAARGDALILEERNEKYGLSVSLFIDPELISGSMSGYRRVSAILALAALSLCVAAAVIYALRNAKPVARIVSAANEISRGAGVQLPAKTPAQTDYQYLNEFIGQVRSQVKLDRQRLSHQEILIIENLFERLLRDEAYSQETFSIAQKYLADFPETARMTLLRMLDVGNVLSADYSSMQTRLMEIAKGAIQTQLYAHFTADMMVLITPSEGEDADTLVKSVQRICEEARTTLDVEIRAAISLPFTGLHHLGGAFKSLRHALRFGDSARASAPYLQRAQACVASEGAAADVSTARFSQLLLAGEAEKALDCLDGDLARMRGAFAREEDAAQAYYLYRHALLRAAADAPDSVRLDAPPPPYSAEGALDDSFGGLRACARAFAQAVAEYRRQDDESFESAVLRAIEENIGSPDLCVRMITERFSVSESHLQRVMHRAAGDTFFGYVEGKRMARARRLLTQTDLPIREIMEKCGYASLNSFYKAFKRFYGQPPSALRNEGE